MILLSTRADVVLEWFSRLAAASVNSQRNQTTTNKTTLESCLVCLRKFYDYCPNSRGILPSKQMELTKQSYSELATTDDREKIRVQAACSRASVNKDNFNYFLFCFQVLSSELSWEVGNHSESSCEQQDESIYKERLKYFKTTRLNHGERRLPAK